MKFNKAFTLIELMLCIVIMAFIAQATFMMTSNTLDADEVVSRKTNELFDLQAAFRTFDNDIIQMVPRSTRFTGSTTRTMIQTGNNLFGSQGASISFCRSGSLNPGALLPRGEVVRIWYRFKDNKIERASYSYPDTIIGFEPTFEVVLEGVKEFKIFYYDNGTWVENRSNPNYIPLGIKFEMELENYGKIERIYNIVAGGVQ